MAAALLLNALPLSAQETPSATADTAAPASAEAGFATESPTLETIPLEEGAAPAAQAAPEEPVNRILGEIVVTAQKREENLRDVPISVAAFSGESLEARGVDDPGSLVMVTPGLTYNELVGYSLIYIRGVGSDAFEPTADQSIATYIDGVYLPFGHGLAQNFTKLERIEVLKGPQGTLFGRNATGGAINIITRKPDDSFEINLDAGIGKFDSREAKAFITGPITDWLSASLSGLYSKADSYYKMIDESPVQELVEDETKGLNARLQIEPADEFSISLNTLITRFEGSGSIPNTLEDAKPILGLPLGFNRPGPGEASLDYQPYLAADSDLYYGQIAWMPDAFDIKLSGSYQKVNTDLRYDFDSSPAPLVYFHASNQFAKVKTGELQLLSKEGGIFPDWMQVTSGLYYFKSDTGYDPVIFGLLSAENPFLLDVVDRLLALFPDALPLPTSGVNLTLYSTIATEAEAAYLQTTFNITDWLDLTLGGRYQHEKRGTTQADVNLTTSGGDLLLIPFGLDSTTRNDFSPKATISVKASDDQLIYVTASRASKSGTYNLPAIYTPPRYVKPEKVTAYEIGNKGSLFDDTLRYNLAAYFNQIEDLQTQIVSLQSGGAQNLVNADEAEIKGVDLDFTWQMFPETIPGFVLTAAGAYIDGEYTSFPDGSGYRPGSGLFFGPGSLTLLPPEDFAGNDAVRTPKWSFTIGPNLALPVPGGTLEIGGDWYYNDGYYFDTQNTSKQPKYELFNARVSYMYEPAGLRLTVFGKNLTDEEYYVNRFQTDFATNSLYGEPRIWGVRLSYEFKS
jgi:iron complex outermembrane receptor protein